ncbi:MAG TPA: Lrp/AsnC family transcriptional regulator [Acidobacteriota bacterium]|nr:Lrp/AsnC family transcriptional regulator [Acidobacteriota bacterium]
MLDDISVRILNIIQQNARTSNAEIARRVGMAPSAIFERIRKLESQGVIQGYAANLDPQVLGLELVAYVFVSTDERDETIDTGKELSGIPEVQEVHMVDGEDCYLVKVRAADTVSLADLIRKRIRTIATVRSTRTTIVLKTLKESVELPLQPVLKKAAGE